MYVKDTPPGRRVLSQYLPSRSFKIATSLVCGLDIGTASKDAVLFYFLRFSPLLPLKSYLVFPFQKQYPYFSVRKCKKGHFLCGFAALNQYPYCRLLLILYRTFIRSDVTLGRLQYDFLTTFFDFFTSSIELANNSPFDPRCSSSSLR